MAWEGRQAKHKKGELEGLMLIRLEFFFLFFFFGESFGDFFMGIKKNWGSDFS